MNPLKTLMFETIGICLVLTVVIMVALRLFFKKYGAKIFDWYMNELDRMGYVYIFTGLLELALLIAFWYWIYTLIF